MKVTRSIRSHLLTSYILLSIIPLLFLGSALSVQSYKNQLKVTKRLHHEVSRNAALEITDVMDNVEDILLNVSKFTELIKQTEREQYNTLSWLRSHKGKEKFDLIDDITLLDSKGREKVRISRLHIFTPANYGDRSQKAEYRIPVTQRKTYFSPVYFDRESGYPLMTMSIPLIDTVRGTVEGILVSEILLKFMWEKVNKIKIGKSGTAYILDSTGRVVAHPDPSVTLAGTYHNIPNKQGFMTGLSGGMAFITKKNIQAWGQTLYLISEMPAAEAMGMTRNSLVTITICVLLTLTAALALGLIIIRKIVRPVEALSHTALAVSRGEIARKAVIQSNDEFGVLSNTFNEMTETLTSTITSLRKKEAALRTANKEIEEWNRELERRVQEKTKALESSQAQLIQSEKLSAMGEMASGLAHELNSPLAGLLPMINKYKDEAIKGSESYMELSLMLKACNHMAKIIKDFSAFSRASKGELSRLSLNEIIEDTLSFSSKKLIHRNVDILKEYASHLPLVKGEKTELQQVVLNMINNACDAMPGGGTLVIRTACGDNNSLIIIFIDNGTGIDRKNLSKVFDPFFTTKRPGKGTGLGLSVSYNIIAKHGGKITVDPAPVKGTIFTITLPAVKHDEKDSII